VCHHQYPQTKKIWHLQKSATTRILSEWTQPGLWSSRSSKRQISKTTMGFLQTYSSQIRDWCHLAHSPVLRVYVTALPYTVSWMAFLFQVSRNGWAMLPWKQLPDISKWQGRKRESWLRGSGDQFFWIIYSTLISTKTSSIAIISAPLEISFLNSTKSIPPKSSFGV